jgi:hypothetical protein
MMLSEDKATGEAVICSVWGPRTDWIRNFHAHPAVRVQIGRESFVPQHRFLTDEEAFAVGVEFRRRHPWRVRMIRRVLGGRARLGRRDAGIHQHPPIRRTPPEPGSTHEPAGSAG